jgi:hypothetical protein
MLMLKVVAPQYQTAHQVFPSLIILVLTLLAAAVVALAPQKMALVVAVAAVLAAVKVAVLFLTRMAGVALEAL